MQKLTRDQMAARAAGTMRGSGAWVGRRCMSPRNRTMSFGATITLKESVAMIPTSLTATTRPYGHDSTGRLTNLASTMAL